MKKLICTAAALIMGANMSLSAYAKNYGEVTVLGDSIATGYGLAGYSAGDNYSAAGSFGSLIAKDSSGYENIARDGATSEALLSRLDDADAKSAVSGADSVIISIGGNDFLVPMMNAVAQAIPEDSDYIAGLMDGSVSFEDFLQQMTGAVLAAAQSVDVSKSGENVEGIINKIRAVNPDCDIYILTVYDPFEDISGLEMIEVMAKTRLPQLNEGIAAAAKNGGAQVVDVYSAFAGHAAEYTNINIMDIHPSAAGHEVIYSLLADALKEHESASAPDDSNDSKQNPDTGSPVAAFVGAGVFSAAAVLVILRRKEY